MTGTLSQSCASLAKHCGAAAQGDCCESMPVPGGTYSRSYDGVDYLDPSAVATVSAFSLDRYEVTVGRFRAFVEADMGTQAHPPGAGAGAHPKIAGSGWRVEFTKHLAQDTQALKSALACIPQQTWTPERQSRETFPINCVNWYTAFAFCIWDGGRLPTEAEWNFAASGGSEHRFYPWSQPPDSALIDDTFAVYCGGTCDMQAVGSRSPKGDGRWGQADLGGNAWEWVLDWDPVKYRLPCVDCAEVNGGRYRAFRGGSNDDLAPTLRAATRHVYFPDYRGNIGLRCARAL